MTLKTTASYVVTVRPELHELEVELTLTGLGPGPVKLAVPTWVPGEYDFAKYGRDVINVRASDPSALSALPVTRDGWSGFVVDAASDRVKVEYTAYAFDPSRTAQAGLVDTHQALLLGTRYLQHPGHRGPCRVTYGLPAPWRMHHCEGAREVTPRTYEYPSYQELLDTPVVAGQFERLSRVSHEHQFYFVFLDRAVGYEAEVESFLDSVMAVVGQCYEIFGSFPFETYTFILAFNPAVRWRIGHAHSATIALDPATFIDEEVRSDSVRACARVFFRVWHGSRLKPSALVNPDLLQGTFTDGLWMTEGFTRYYELLLSTRTGALSPERFLSQVVNDFRRHESLPASGRISAADASRAAFLKRGPYPGSINGSIDYEDVGMLIAFDLDAAVRLEGTKNSFDVLFSVFYTLFHDHGFTTADFKRFMGEHNRALEELIEREADAPAGLSTARLLGALGFEVVSKHRPYLGLMVDECRPSIIANVLDTSPAGRAGLAPGDEILRVNGFVFSQKAMRWLVAHEEHVTLDVKRGKRPVSCSVRVAERPEVTELKWRGRAEQLALWRSWLHAPELSFQDGQPIPLDHCDPSRGRQEII